jgi:hypothetical protein
VARGAFRIVVSGVAGLVLALAAAPAHGAQTVSLSADRPETGWIRLQVSAPGGGTVDLAEQIGSEQKPLGQATVTGGRAVVNRAETWRCDRLTRHFVATLHAPDGSSESATADIDTPSCAKRLDIQANVVRNGAVSRVAVRVVDRWRVGDVPARVCAGGPLPLRKSVCRPADIARARSQTELTYRATGSGLWTVSLVTEWGQTATRRVYVRPRHGLRMLATGDSMIEYVDTALMADLGRRGARVRTDPRVSTGISKPFLLDWPKLARKQASGMRPDVTVIFLGANDGFPFGNVRCCTAAWVDAYAARAARMMSAYSRGGAGLVYWLTLPTPKPAQWRSIYPAVNRALRKAAAGFEGFIRVIDLAKVFTPGGRFRESMMWRGRRVTVRQTDGVHLSPEGARIAASVIESALRQDGALSTGRRAAASRG